MNQHTNRHTDDESPSASALTISEVTEAIRLLLEHEIGSVWVKGEVSNFRRVSSGHCYFTLKDDNAQLRCVMWRSTVTRLSVLPEDGIQILARGDLTVYAPHGQHQLVVAYVQPEGIGALQQAFEELKARLHAEGLFSPDRKRPIPQWPKVVGVATSATGAAVRDIIDVISRRMPTTRILIRPTVVQGERAAPDIVSAIRELNEQGESDVIVVGRGGGSLEDLWAFNEEPVVRAIVDSNIPVVSAVGHEIDVTLSDFAADVRAATPSAAAELVVPDRREVREFVATAYTELGARLRRRVDAAEERLTATWGPDTPRRVLDRIDRMSQDVDRLTESIGHRADRLITHRISRFRHLAGTLDALSPIRILARGYAVASKENGDIIKDASDVNPKDRFRVRVSTGIILGIVDSRIGS